MKNIVGGIFALKPWSNTIVRKNDRHPPMDSIYRFIRLRCEDAIAKHSIPECVNSRHIEEITPRQRKSVLSFRFIPFKKAGTRYNAPLIGNAFAEDVKRLGGF